MQLFAKGSEEGIVSVLKMSAFHFCRKKNAGNLHKLLKYTVTCNFTITLYDNYVTFFMRALYFSVV